MKKILILFFSSIIAVAVTKAEVQTNPSFRQKLGSSWEQELKEIVATANKNPCNTCGSASGLSLGRTSMDEYLDNIDYFITHIDINR